MPTLRILILLVAGILGTEALAQQIAYIASLPSPGEEASGEHGNAWLFSRGGACFAVTPLHVLRDPSGTRDDRYARLSIARTGEHAGSGEAQGDRCAVLPESDLALLRVTGVASVDQCGVPLAGIGGLDSLLAANPQAALASVRQNGAIVRSALTVRSSNAGDDFWVSVLLPNDRIAQGMSGSVIQIQDKPVGVLMSIDNDSSHTEYGMARVKRLDRIGLLLTRIFDGSSAASIENPTCLQSNFQVSPERIVAASAGNRANFQCGAKVLTWSTPPISQESRPDNLVGSGGETAAWRAAANSEEVDVDILLCRQKDSALSRIRFDASLCGPGDNIGYTVEAIGNWGQPGWSGTSIGWTPMPVQGIREISTGIPISADMIRLRVVSSKKNLVHNLCLGVLNIE